MPRLASPQLLHSFLNPLYALGSVGFYFKVLFRMRGTGFLYLLLWCALLALPAAWRSDQVMDYLRALNIPQLVAQLPASYLNSQGVLTPEDPKDDFLLLKNEAGAPAIAYNPGGKALEGEALEAPVEFGAEFVRIRTSKGPVELPYSGFFELNTTFHPAQLAGMLDALLSIGAQTVWSVLVLWFFFILAFNSLLDACIARFVMLAFFKIRTTFLCALRLCCYANTAVGVLLCSQFFVSFPLSYTVMVLVPLIYIVLFSRLFRLELSREGVEGFAKKYAPGAVPPAGRKAFDSSAYDGSMYRREQERRAREEQGQGGKSDLPEDPLSQELAAREQKQNTDRPAASAKAAPGGEGKDPHGMPEDPGVKPQGGADNPQNPRGGGPGGSGFFEA